MKNYKTIIQLSILLLLTATTFILSALSTEENKHNSKTITVTPVKIEPISRKSEALTFGYTGKLSPATSTNLAFKTGGYISYIIPENVTSVKKRTILAQLDTEEINARVRQAKEGFEKAQRDFNRAEKLFSDKAISKELWQNTATALSVAEENYRIAHYNLKHSTIHAPSNGRILKKLAEKNDLVAPGTPLFVFGSLDKGWKAVINLSERDAARITLNNNATISFSALPGIKAKGQITSISDSPDPYTGTYKTEVTLSEKLKNIRSGYTVDVSIFPKSLNEIIWIPSNALTNGNGQEATVFVPHGDTAKEIKITIEGFRNGKIAISKNSFPFENIITDGATYIKNKDKINSTSRISMLMEKYNETN